MRSAQGETCFIRGLGQDDLKRSLLNSNHSGILCSGVSAYKFAVSKAFFLVLLFAAAALEGLECKIPI